jgi:hypothetical protein
LALLVYKVVAVVENDLRGALAEDFNRSEIF